MDRFSLLQKNEPLVMLTAYDALVAKIAVRAGVDILLVGDSVGTNVLGYTSIQEVTLEDICHHTAAVRRGAPSTHVMSDLPYEVVYGDVDIVEAARKICSAGADSVKIELEDTRSEMAKKLVDAGFAVCTHIGYTPQTPDLSVSVQGKDERRARELIKLAKESEAVGAFMIVLELIPAQLAQCITQELSIPTIGIGAGPHCSGQVQVCYDITGFSDHAYRHTQVFASAMDAQYAAFQEYTNAVRGTTFPTLKNCASVPESFIESLKNAL